MHRCKAVHGAVRLGVLLSAERGRARRDGHIVAAPLQHLLHLAEEQVAPSLARLQSFASALQPVAFTQQLVLLGWQIGHGLNLTGRESQRADALERLLGAEAREGHPSHEHPVALGHHSTL